MNGYLFEIFFKNGSIIKNSKNLKRREREKRREEKRREEKRRENSLAAIARARRERE